MKILLIAVICFAMVGIAGVAGLYYVGHRAKRWVEEKTAAYNPIPDSRETSPSTANRSLKACELLSKQEAENLLGEPIVRAEPQGESCIYYGPPGLSAELAQKHMDRTMHDAQQPGAQPNGSDIATAVDQLANSVGQTGPDGAGGPLLILAVTSDGASQMAALRASKALFGGIFKASGMKGDEAGNQIPGLGEQAIRMPKLGLSVLQRGMMVRVIPGPVDDPYTKDIAIARTVLAKLR